MKMDDLVPHALGFCPQTGYNPAWRQLAAATPAPARCSLAVTRYGVRSS